MVRWGRWVCTWTASLVMPEGNHRREWAVGMKCVVDLPEGCDWKPGTVLHTIGYPGA